MKNQLVFLDEIHSIGFNAIITNAYLLKKHIQKIEKIHSVLNFNGVIMTDSGAYQLLRYGSVDVANLEIVEYQCEIGSDIGVILDVPTHYNVSYDKAVESAETTIQRAIEARIIIEKCSNTLWTLPIQGGTYLELLRRYALKSDEVAGYGYSLFALGSPTTLLENYIFEKIIDMIVTVKSHIRPSYPLHLFGAGHPLIMPFVIALGVDLMDSASYVLYAKDGRYMTRKGTYKLNEISYFPCSCPMCSRYTVEEIKNLPKQDVQRFLALHNLYTLFRELSEIKECIKEGRLWEYLEEKARTHPTARRAFDAIKKNLEYIYKRSPREKPRGKAIFILSEDSLYNPKIMLARREIISKILHTKKYMVFIPFNSVDRLNPRKLIKELLNHNNSKNCNFYAYYPILGIIPYTLINTYPFSQFETYYEFTPEAAKDLAYVLMEYVLKIRDSTNYDIEVKIYVKSDIEWQYKFKEIIKEYVDLMKNKGIDIKLLELSLNQTI